METRLGFGGVCLLTTAILCACKYFGYLQCSWVMCLLPVLIWFGIVLFLMLAAIVCVILAIVCN